MKKGFMKDLRPTLPPDLYTYVWNKAMIGKSNILNEEFYTSMPEWKRGLIHTPSLKGANIQENGSFFLELLQQLTISAVNRGAPVLIDMFYGDVAYRINGQLDLVFEYVGYIKAHWVGLEKKPLLRLNQGQWNAYCTDNLKNTLGLLNTVDILVSAPNSEFPPNWNNLSEVKWFEYYSGMIANEDSGIWLESPSLPDTGTPQDPPDDPETPPDDPQNPPDDPQSPPTVISTGFPIRTTIKGKVGWKNVDLDIENFFE